MTWFSEKPVPRRWYGADSVNEAKLSSGILTGDVRLEMGTMAGTIRAIFEGGKLEPLDKLDKIDISEGEEAILSLIRSSASKDITAFREAAEA